MTPDLFIPTADPIPVPPNLSTLADLEVPLNRPRFTPEPLPTPAAPTPEPIPGQADLAKIPPSVASKLRASFGTVKAWNQRVALARQTDQQFQGGGRYTWEATNGTQMEEPETIQMFREMAPKNGVDADAALAAMGYEPPTHLMPSEMNESNVSQRNATPEPDLDQVDSLAEEILDLNAQIDALTRKRDDLKAMLLGTLQSSNIETLTTARVKITQVASARQVSLNVKPERLPEIYQVVKSDDAAIRKAIDAGVDLSAYLSLKPPTYYLKITPQHRR